MWLVFSLRKAELLSLLVLVFLFWVFANVLRLSPLRGDACAGMASVVNNWIPPPDTPTPTSKRNLKVEKDERKKERTFSTEKKKKKNFRIIVDQVGFQQFDKVGR